MALTILVWVMTKRGNSFEVSLPAKRILCPRCDGKGHHVNPSIDGNGISPDEFAEDPDFEEAYFSGRYDVTCEKCHGKNVVDVVDVEQLTPKMKDRYWRQMDSDAADRRDAESERRLGA